MILPKSENKNLRTVHITELDKKGRGLGTTNTGGKMCVPGTILGEHVQVEKLKRKEGRLLDVLEPSPHRIVSICPHFSVCGGCAWQHIDYTHQLKIKQDRIRTLFLQNGIDINGYELGIEPSPPFEYRNRMDFVWWFDGRFGLRERGKWHAVVDLEECHLIPDEYMNIALEVNRRAHELQLPFRDQKKRKPGLRYLIVRHVVLTGELMLLFVTDTMELPSSLWQDIKQVTCVYQLINDNLENDTSDGFPVHLAGNAVLKERVDDRIFQIGPRSFFQPNPAVAEKMVSYLKSLFPAESATSQNLLDLYCGVGLFSVSLQERFNRVLGIECLEEAVALARRNSTEANSSFVCCDANEITDELFQNMETLIVDPPREGIMPKILRQIIEARFKNIVYISCNPRKGIQDLTQLLSHYRLQSIRLFDQFPQTPHVEMIAFLE